MIAYTADLGLDSWGSYDLHKVIISIKFVKDPSKTRMYQGLRKNAWEYEKLNLTYNSHRFGISPKTFENDNGLKQFWDVTAISFMPNGTEFTASIEAKKYPIFGT